MQNARVCMFVQIHRLLESMGKLIGLESLILMRAAGGNGYMYPHMQLSASISSLTVLNDVRLQQSATSRRSLWSCWKALARCRCECDFVSLTSRLIWAAHSIHQQGKLQLWLLSVAMLHLQELHTLRLSWADHDHDLAAALLGLADYASLRKPHP